MMILNYESLFDWIKDMSPSESEQGCEENNSNGITESEEVCEENNNLGVPSNPVSPSQLTSPVSLPESSTFAPDMPSSTRYTILCNGNTVFYCCCYYFYKRIEQSSQSERVNSKNETFYVPVSFFLLSQIAAPDQLCSLLPSIVQCLSCETESMMTDIEAFILRDAIRPIPNLLSIQFTLNQKEFILNSFATPTRSFNRFQFINHITNSFLFKNTLSACECKHSSRYPITPSP